MPYCDTNGIRLHYLEHPGDGPALILMPGLTANAHAFDGLIAAGLSEHFRVFAVDLRGRGLSDKPAEGYDMAAHGADVLGLMDALGLEDVILGGHSFGGLLSFWLAAHHPQRMRSLLIIDAAGSMHPDTRQMIQPAVDRLSQTLPSFEAYLALMKQAPYLHQWWDPQIETYYRADVETLAGGAVRPRSSPTAIIAAVEGALAEPWSELLGGIRHPTLLVNATGAYGPPGAPPLLPKELALETVEQLSAGAYAEVPGNHMTMLFGDGAACIVGAVTRHFTDL